MTAPTIPVTDMATLLAEYEVILLDAYGVLVNLEGPLPGAARLIDRLNQEAKRYMLVSNSASKLAENAARQYQSWGLAIPAERIVTAGGLLPAYFEREGLVGARACVLGTGDSRRLAELAGAEVLDQASVRAGADFDVLVLADQAFMPFWDSFDAALGALFRRLDSGCGVRLVLPNPDLIYPRAGGFGFTSGSLALMLEEVLRRRYPERADLRFDALGKPHAPIFSEAMRRAGAGRAVMVGDQLETDIIGARGVGIDAALLTGGVSRVHVEDVIYPTFLLPGIEI
jgi:HAD superfamily hydrolase (TIGR01450 family)